MIYLTDGDKPGSDYLSDLRASNVPESRLKSLPPGASVEDLLDRDFLISVINSLLPESAPRPTARIFRATWTAGRSITKWAEDTGVALGKVAIAYEIIDQDSNIELAPGAAETLRDLHEQFMAAFKAGNAAHKAPTP